MTEEILPTAEADRRTMADRFNDGDVPPVARAEGVSGEDIAHVTGGMPVCAHCGGWGEHMSKCVMMGGEYSEALSTRPADADAPDWRAVTQAAWDENNPADADKGVDAELEVVAWRWKTPIAHVGDGTRWGWSFASHQSTPPPSIFAQPLVTQTSAAAALEAADEAGRKLLNQLTTVEGAYKLLQADLVRAEARAADLRKALEKIKQADPHHISVRIASEAIDAATQPQDAGKGVGDAD